MTRWPTTGDVLDTGGKVLDGAGHVLENTGRLLGPPVPSFGGMFH